MNKIKNNKTVDFHVRTHFRIYEYNFKWILENYSRLKNEQYFRSPQFYPETGSYWWISIHKSCKKISLHMYRSGGHGEVDVQCEVTVASCHDKIWSNCTKSYIFNNIEKSVTIVGILLSEEEVKNEYNDSVEVILQFKIYKADTNQLDSRCFSSEEAFQRDIQKSLSEDLVSFYESPLNTDVVLSIGGATLGVHKAILCARSPVFAKMFQQEMKESTDHIVVIKDVSMTTMKEVVAFMYGKVKREYCHDRALKIYYAADKYDIKQLKEICGYSLLSKLSMENAYKVLLLADRHNDKSLMKKVIKFISFYNENEEDVKKNLLGHTGD